ncbi:hypothetical protein AVEN_32370-1 [Araneus ventricosus]|uniref:Uncharacterized protein n=1 Tax=Araneus ventricosus TaxID=182803 RepID=A0A4Y2NVK6_ARAVE|nr:hypothetical protein AVEN_116939-1 [Araneus ventricosus]GBN43161.1 hypothetical protein AVEN_32370-1 [Araneus ventricosus]
MASERSELGSHSDLQRIGWRAERAGGGTSPQYLLGLSMHKYSNACPDGSGAGFWFYLELALSGVCAEAGRGFRPPIPPDLFFLIFCLVSVFARVKAKLWDNLVKPSLE